jgi:hypothetical protein
MHIEAFPMRFVALTDGVRGGQEHVVIFFEHAETHQPHGFALSLSDARALLLSLRGLLPTVQNIQERLAENN